MIHVKKRSEDSTQKVITTFLKRVKKSNLVSRKRKTQFAASKPTKHRRKQKALLRVEFEQNQKTQDRIGKR